MTVVALQGLRGGAGTTSITAGLAWALKQLGERVLAVDLCPDNMLRLNFNMPVDAARGWARAERDGAPWHQAAMRYEQTLDFLPFGQLTPEELYDWTSQQRVQPDYWLNYLEQLKSAGQYQWILLDIPFSYPLIEHHLLSAVDLHITVCVPDLNGHIRLHQQALANGSHILISQFAANSQLQQDLSLLWQQSVTRLLPLTIHRDEAVAEALAEKKPIGEYSADSLAAGELLTLANWCLLNGAEKPA
jgi:cellulose synthase operon protein YhjQ